MPTAAELMARTGPVPITAESLAADLAALGVQPGALLLVHSSLSALGWVAGGAPAVVEALRRAVGPTGTVLVPTHTNHLSEPSNWRNPPAPPEWWPAIRAGMTPFRADETPSYFMGAIPECLRARRDAHRSAHPHFSFAGLGPAAEALLADHALADGLGEASPLGRLYAADGQVLLLGVGHDSNTTLHLAEHRARWPGKRRRAQGAPVEQAGARAWLTFTELDLSSDDFPALGQAFAEAGHERVGRAGMGQARLMRARPLVDFGVPWLEQHRA